MKNKLSLVAVLLLLCVLPARAIVNGRSLTGTLKDLHVELGLTYGQRVEAQQHFEEDYDRQRQRMLDVIKRSNDLSILLYMQEQDMTFDMAYALKKVTADYKDFNRDRRPYDRIISGLNYEVDRYARLIEAMRRLPPVMKEVEIVPDSLQYHNDSLDKHLSSIHSSLEREIIRIAVRDTASAPLILDAEGESYRDSCILLASGLLKIYADNRMTVVADSVHYQEAYLRLKESYDYAELRYRNLEKYVFTDGQTPVLEILSAPAFYWNKLKADCAGQYDFSELTRPDKEMGENANPEELTRRGTNAFLVVVCFIQLVALILTWLLMSGILWLIGRFTRLRKYILGKRLPLLSLFVGTALYFLLFGYMWKGDEYVQMGVKNVNTFLWLLMAISGSLLLRVKPAQLRNGFWLYMPTIFFALVLIVCRNAFVPDSVINFLFPVALLLAILRQLFGCIRQRGRVTSIDSTLGWISLAVYLLCFVCAFMGFAYASLLIFVWWYFMLAILLSIVCVADLMNRFKERWLNKRIRARRARITYVTGEDRETLLFGTTWFYELVRQVALPVMILISIPFCVHISLNIFDFNDLFTQFYHTPFVRLTDSSGAESLNISANDIVNLLVVFFVLRYLNRAVIVVWKYMRYTLFMRKFNRTSIRDNEINLSLDKSIINVLIWMSYAILVVDMLNIPTGSLSMIAGGLSAGIGLAMKDIINNFIYGIQLMGGRLRVGDWIECDGVRGRVTAINYQCVQVETEEGTEMSFLNESLFGKNFNNLTRNNSYELTQIVVGVAYGTDVEKVREVLVEAMQQMRTKDKYGREIVEPKFGIRVVVHNMSDSSVEVAVRQQVLVAERIGYVHRSKEVIYNALNAAGITIPFPQCDVHLINEALEK